MIDRPALVLIVLQPLSGVKGTLLSHPQVSTGGFCQPEKGWEGGGNDLVLTRVLCPNLVVAGSFCPYLWVQRPVP